MSAEVQATLDRMAQIRNVANRDEIVKPAVRLLRHRERKEREDELEGIEGQLSAPPWAAAAISADGRKALAKRKRQLERELKDWSPRTDLSDEAKNALCKRSKELEEQIRQGMPTSEVMRRNPVGAVDAHRKWNRMKDKVLEWKNIQIQLNPDSDDIDLCNVERLRPVQAMPGQPATFMADAQIPGNFAFSEKQKENWPLGEPTATTAISHLTKDTSPELPEELKARTERETRPLRAKGGKGVPHTVEGQIEHRRKIRASRRKGEERRLKAKLERVKKRLEKLAAAKAAGQEA